jgi:hypothetical protein
MDHQMISKQFFDLQRIYFDNFFNAMIMLQDQAERATNMFLESSLLPIPEEGKGLVRDWLQAFKKGRDEFKRAMDESFDQTEKSFTRHLGPAR